MINFTIDTIDKFVKQFNREKLLKLYVRKYYQLMINFYLNYMIGKRDHKNTDKKRAVLLPTLEFL